MIWAYVVRKRYLSSFSMRKANIIYLLDLEPGKGRTSPHHVLSEGILCNAGSHSLKRYIHFRMIRIQPNPSWNRKRDWLPTVYLPELMGGLHCRLSKVG